jgi:hypothetical protein
MDARGRNTTGMLGYSNLTLSPCRGVRAATGRSNIERAKIMRKLTKLYLTIAFIICILIGLVGCRNVEVLPNMPTLIIGGAEYQINRSTINDMSGTFTVQEHSNKFVEPGAPQHFTLASEEDDKMIVGVYNDSNVSMKFQECKIYEITVNQNRFQNSPIAFSNGASFSSDINEISEAFGASASSTSDGVSTTYCWVFADGTLYITIETGNGDFISMRMLSNVDPHTASLLENESTQASE